MQWRMMDSDDVALMLLALLGKMAIQNKKQKTELMTFFFHGELGYWLECESVPFVMCNPE
jgi:hypothetical protein